MPWTMGVWRRRAAVLRCLAFLPVLATLPSEEMSALHEIFLAADIPWDGDPCNSTPKVTVCDNGHVTRLLLPQGNLTSLPKSVARLQKLENLDVESNQLSSLPASIGQLQALSDLTLDFNKLSSLPESIGQLRKLSELSLQGNRLASLPESIGQLRNLSGLVLSDNQLTSLPESIGQLQALDSLFLNGNRLASLPESIFQLHRLDQFSVNTNLLTSLPESIGRLQSLRYLSWNENHLTSLPKSIGQLQSLSGLYLEGNKLASLPESIGDLRALNRLSLVNNRLASLPESIGQLPVLGVLALQGNKLTSLPESIGQLPALYLLNVGRNQMRSLPESLGNSKSLTILDLHSNFLTQLPGNLTNLAEISVVDLHSNELHDPLDVCKLGLHLTNLFLHDNALKGPIPWCLKDFKFLEVLTLHRNALTGSIPGAFGWLKNLTLLTLHENRLSGVIPQDLAKATRLSLVSAHLNDLEGPIPPLKLKNDCADDNSFFASGGFVVFTCRNIVDIATQELYCSAAEMLQYCPKSCGFCNKTSSHGPVFLVHQNRLSCSLPKETTNWPEAMRSISLIGNKLGDGHDDLPSWIHKDEHQPFLYLSSNAVVDMFKKMILLVALFVAGMLLLVRKTGVNGFLQILRSEAGALLTHKAHRFLLQMSIPLSVAGVILFSLYHVGATYYLCSDWFSSSALSNFSNPDHSHAVAEWAVAIMWAIWILVGAIFLRRAPNPRPEREMRRCCEGCLQRLFYSFLWLCIVTILSFPSIFYAISSSIPSNNTLSLPPWWQYILHYQAALIMVLVDMFITPRAVAMFSARSGLRRSMLFMAGRLVTMWLAATLTTLYLSTHCLNGWTFFWKVCDETTKDYAVFNITFGDTQILEPKVDLCSASMSWWGEGKCMRSIVDTMGPLLLSKMITRAFLQPMLTLVKWQVSHLEDGQLYLNFRIRRYLFCGNAKKICTSNSLEQGQQVSLLVTFAEVALLWGPLVPLLLPAVILATCTNLLMCQIGHVHFLVEHQTLDTNPTGMSRRYLHGTLGVLLCFQNWFAWTSEMNGRWLLLIAAVVYVSEVLFLGISYSGANGGANVEMSAPLQVEAD